MFYLKKKFIEKNWRIINDWLYNNGKDLFIIVNKDGKREKFYVKFRQNPAFIDGKPIGFFQKFGELFPEFHSKHKEMGSFGESINKEILENALSLETDRLLFCYNDDVVYSAYPLQFYKLAKENNLIRTPLNGKEQTMSAPYGLLEKFDFEVDKNAQ